MAVQVQGSYGAEPSAHPHRGHYSSSGHGLRFVPVTGLVDAPVLAHVVRSGTIESVHHGIAVVTAPDGRVEFAVGDAAARVFPRSTNKPIHAVAALRAGARLDLAGLALAAASHSGERQHLAGVRAMLEALDLGEEDLRNTPDLPLGEQERERWIREGRGPARVAQGCSGNHAAMLGASAASGWDLESYLEADHPFQQLARATTEELAGERTGEVAVDGCGTAVFALPLVGLARAYGRLAAATLGYERDVADAMRLHPEFVAGEGRFATSLMRAVTGAIAKDGAEGVFAIGLPDGRGLAVKIADGAARPIPAIVVALLARVAVSDAALDVLGRVAVLGHGEPVGLVEPAPAVAAQPA